MTDQLSSSLERFQANLTRLLLDEDEQLNLRIIEMVLMAGIRAHP